MGCSHFLCASLPFIQLINIFSGISAILQPRSNTDILVQNSINTVWLLYTSGRSCIICSVWVFKGDKEHAFHLNTNEYLDPSYLVCTQTALRQNPYNISMQYWTFLPSKSLLKCIQKSLKAFYPIPLVIMDPSYMITDGDCVQF